MKESEMIFGIHAITQALQANKEIDKIIIKRDLNSNLSRELMDELKNHPTVQVQRVPVERLNKYTQKNHEGAIAFICKVEYQKVSDLVPQIFEQGKDPLLVILDGVTDVRNFGSIARTCDCAGVDAVVLPMRGGVMVNADAMKTSAGALNTLPVCREFSLGEAMKYVKNSGLKVVAISRGAKKTYDKLDYTGPMAIVFSDDRNDVSDLVLRSADEVVSIPVKGSIESLNVSVAAGVVLYEAMKQRK